MKQPEAPPTWKYVLFGVVVGGGILSAFGFVIVRAVIEMNSGGAVLTKLCATRLSQVAKAQFLYAADNDETLPIAKSWLDATWTYGEQKGPKGKKLDPRETNENIFRCPVISVERSGGYGYAFNQSLSSKKTGVVPPEEILLFDSRLTERNAVGLPGKDDPVPARHNKGSVNVACTSDGSIRLTSGGN